MTRQIKLSELITTAGTQIRAAMDEQTVAEYGLAMRAGAKFPPVIVFQAGEKYILADGFHRALAAACEGLESIEAEARQGSRTDALKYALSANAAHGLRRTNADKRRAVGKIQTSGFRDEHGQAVRSVRDKADRRMCTT